MRCQGHAEDVGQAGLAVGRCRGRSHGSRFFRAVAAVSTESGRRAARVAGRPDCGACLPVPFRPDRLPDLQLPCAHILTDLEDRSLILRLSPFPQAALAQLSSELIFSAEPLLGTSNPIRVNLIEQSVISLDDSVLPQIPESREVIANAHGAVVVWVRVVPGRRICERTERTVLPVRL